MITSYEDKSCKFLFKSVYTKLVDLCMNLYQEAALSLRQEFGDSCLKPKLR